MSLLAKLKQPPETLKQVPKCLYSGSMGMTEREENLCKVGQMSVKSSLKALHTDPLRLPALREGVALSLYG